MLKHTDLCLEGISKHNGKYNNDDDNNDDNSDDDNDDDDDDVKNTKGLSYTQNMITNYSP